MQKPVHIDEFWRCPNGPPVFTVVRSAAEYHKKSDDEMVRVATEVITGWEASAATLPPCFEPNFGTYTMALPWGGRVVDQENSYSHILPVSDNIDAVLAIEPSPNLHAEKAVRQYKRICKAAGRDDIRFMTPDHQGVLDTAGMIMHQEALFAAMMTVPDKVHRLLDAICDANIAFVKYLIANAGRVDGNFWPAMWLPSTVGVCVIEDMMPLLSPELYKEFGLPCLRRYADAFGGIFFHCCGRWVHQMPALAESGLPILGFEYHHPHATLDQIQDHFHNVVVVPILDLGMQKDYPDAASFAADLMMKRKNGTRLWFAAIEGSGHLTVEDLRRVLGEPQHFVEAT